MIRGCISSCKRWFTLGFLQLFAVLAFSQNVYFIDGYHGGIYGHYPKQYTRFITDMLDKNPNWKINLEIEPETWDSVQVNEPENYAAFKKYFNGDQSTTSRMEYVNPAYGQSYFYNINGESIIRQFQYGINKLKQHFPNAVFKSYSSEEPCFTSALPQILTSFGFTAASLKNPNTCWGGYTRAFGGELVNWIGPDGSSITTVPRYAIEAFKPRSTWQTIAFDNSNQYVEAALKDGIQNPVGMCLQDAGWKNGPWLGRQENSYTTTYTTWSDYIKNIARNTQVKDWHFSQEDVQVSLVWGAQVLQQIAKQVRIAENKNVQAEKISSMATVYNGAGYPSDDLDEAWRGVLLAQHHDCWIVPYNGRRNNTWIDKVTGWTNKADSLDDAAISLATKALIHLQPGESNYVRVFNSSSNTRKQIVKVAIPAQYKSGTVSVVDKDRKPVSSQLMVDSIAFAVDVPSMGFTTYQFSNQAPEPLHGNRIQLLQDGTYAMESDLYRLIIDPAKGGMIRSLQAKKMNNKEFVDANQSAGFNSMKGFFFKDNQFFSSIDSAASVIIVENGPLYCKLVINGKINGQLFTQTIALANADPVIDMSVKIDWQGNPGIGEPYKQNGGYRQEDNHKAFYTDTAKLQTLFPLNLANQQVYKNAPFDVTKSTLANTFFQTWDSIKNNVLLNWVDITDGAEKYGMALFSDHTTSYAHGQGYPLALTTQYAGIGLWGRDYSITKSTELHYALVPHQGKWDAAGIWSMNTNWNNKLLVTTFKGELDQNNFSKSLIDFKESGLEVTAAAIEGDDLLVRVFNAEGKSSAYEISFDGNAKQFVLQELNGQTKQLLKSNLTNKRTVIKIAIPRFGIRTIRLKNFVANKTGDS